MLLLNIREVEPSSSLCQASFLLAELKASEKHCLKEIRWDQGENSVNPQLCGSNIGSLDTRKSGQMCGN